MTDSETFRAAIAGLTAAKFAEVAGISAPTVAVYKSGRQPIPPHIMKVALKIRNFLNECETEHRMDLRLPLEKVIDGKFYNTRTADKLGESWNGLPDSDADYCLEQLFRSPRGQHFLVRESIDPEPTLKLLTEAEARTWLERHGTALDYAASFGEVIG